MKFRHLNETGIVLINNMANEYCIEWNDINSPISLIYTLRHICEKSWVEIGDIDYVIEESCKKFKWGYLGKS